MGKHSNLGLSNSTDTQVPQLILPRKVKVAGAGLSQIVMGHT